MIVWLFFRSLFRGLGYLFLFPFWLLKQCIVLPYRGVKWLLQ